MALYILCRNSFAWRGKGDGWTTRNFCKEGGHIYRTTLWFHICCAACHFFISPWTKRFLRGDYRETYGKLVFLIHGRGMCVTRPIARLVGIPSPFHIKRKTICAEHITTLMKTHRVFERQLPFPVRPKRKASYTQAKKKMYEQKRSAYEIGRILYAKKSLQGRMTMIVPNVAIPYVGRNTYPFVLSQHQNVSPRERVYVITLFFEEWKGDAR